MYPPTNREMYHTQEKWARRLHQPIICKRPDAWLGEGYYFWLELQDAESWGHFSKTRTGYFEIYVGQIQCTNVLDTVFNEEHYLFWKRQIELAADSLQRLNGNRPLSIKQLNQYLKDKAKWDVSGILFQDIPMTNNRVNKFFYRKRVQMVVFDLGIISNFAFLYDSPVKPRGEL